MADMKKEQERDELHRAIWAIADELRGSVDGWDFKSYVLGTMFYRYISNRIILTHPIPPPNPYLKTIYYNYDAFFPVGF